MKLVTGSEMREVEAAAYAAGATPAGLMEAAGRGVSHAVGEHLGNARGRRIVILVGPGNNGGDGLVAARYLYDAGAEVTVFLLTPRDEADANLQALRSREMEIVPADDSNVDTALEEALARADAVVDAVLGIGRLRPLEGLLARALDALTHRRCYVFAVDLPSGLDADTGAVDPHTPHADYTLSLGFSKIGVHTWPGSTYAGEDQVVDIGIPDSVGAAAIAHTELLTPEWARARLPGRPLQSNKGTFGRVLVVAGSESYMGAATLSCLGALRAGAGLVTLAAIAPVRAAVAAQLPEVTFLPLPDSDGALDASAGDIIVRALPVFDAMLIGPGLGLSFGTQSVVRGVLSSPAVQNLPIVIDADALNCLARFSGWQDLIRDQCILTPHPGELARLANSSVPEVQAERLPLARRLAVDWKQTLVLKGAHTLVASTDTSVLVSPFATAALATAGTGDVLAGCISGYIAQGVAAETAAGLGVFLHGAAAELYEEEYGTSGLLASELGSGIARVAASLRT